jgi:RimJ/RimL family protein N-acetyltransferase
VGGVVLRAFEEGDFQSLLEAVESSDDLLQWAGPGFSWPLDEAQLQRYLARALEDPENLRPMTVVEDDATVGHVELVIDPTQNLGHVGRVLVVPEARGRGVGTAAMKAVVTLAFDNLRLHRLSLNVFDFNAAAIRCYEHTGFVREGLLRECRRASSGYWSIVPMGMLASDPRRD